MARCECPQCGQRLEVPDALSPKQALRCPKCGDIFRGGKSLGLRFQSPPPRPPPVPEVPLQVEQQARRLPAVPRIIAGIVASVVSIPLGFAAMLLLIYVLGSFCDFRDVRGNTPEGKQLIAVGMGAFCAFAGGIWWSVWWAFGFFFGAARDRPVAQLPLVASDDPDSRPFGL